MSRAQFVRVGGVAALGLAIFLICWGAIHFFRGAAAVAAVWPANALVLAFILRACPTRVCERVAVGVACVAMVAANLAAGRPLGLSLAFPAANVLEILIAVHFLRGVSMPLAELKDLRGFFLGAVLAGPLASATLATAVMALGLDLSGAALLAEAGAWFLADAMGMAIVAPFALSISTRRAWSAWRGMLGPAAVGLIFFALSFQSQAPALLLAFPLVTLAVLYDRDRGGALAIGLVALGLIGSALMGEGSLPRLARYGVDPVVWAQIFLGCLVATAYPLAVMLKRLDAYAAAADRGRAAAEADSRAKRALIGQVGEDLRSPLSGVVTLAEMLRSGRLGDLNPRQRELLGRIAESGAEIEALSREMMNGGERGPARPHEVGGLVVEALRATAFQARQRRLEIDHDLEPGLFTGLDGPRVGRMIEEMIGAAIGASRKGGRVRLTLGTVDGRPRLRIEDDGAETLAARLTAEETAKLDPVPVSGRAFDRAWLRKHGGDLRSGPSTLGGLATELVLPPAADARAA
ncbi:MAG: MASE1 domain-containing protein [Brevundimonas sp.]